MKILCVSDDIDTLVYSPRLKQHFGDVDFVLSAGDLPMEYLGFIASSLNKPVGFVFGNHNLKRLPLFNRRARLPTTEVSAALHTRNFFGATYLEDRVTRIKGLLIVGFGGCMCYNGGRHQFTDWQMFLRMARLVPRLWWNRLIHGRYLDILVTHAAPRGIHDRPDYCHRGFASLLWFMRTFRPRYLLHGHIHLYDINANRVTQHLATQVINVYSHYVLTIGENDEGFC